MATKPNISPPGQGPQHFLPTSMRELRVQSVHRLQIGLIGLAIMLLLVGLANIILERAKLADGGTGQAREAALAADPKAESDPFAVIGAVPSPEASAVPPAADPARSR